jgi:hypothetical protein
MAVAMMIKARDVTSGSGTYWLQTGYADITCIVTHLAIITISVMVVVHVPPVARVMVVVVIVMVRVYFFCVVVMNMAKEVMVI